MVALARKEGRIGQGRSHLVGVHTLVPDVDGPINLGSAQHTDKNVSIVRV